MPVLIVRHVSFEDAGMIAPLLETRGRELRYADLGDELPVETASALILMGGPMSVNDPDPWVPRHIRAIERAMKRSIPILGICLGAQLIAKALGSRVYRNAEKEIGWFPVAVEEDSAGDKMFRGFSEPEPVFHWHDETFDLPTGATRLASSERCRNQAFRYGENVYGLQFHAEVTAAMIEDWCRQDANCGDLRELDGPIDPHEHIDTMTRFAETIFGRWEESFL
jgi:GMP synthase-like glutamine amidotransferase